MRKLTTILITILLLFNIQVSAENYESIIITNPNGANGLVPTEDGMHLTYGDTLPVGTKLTDAKTEEPYAGFDCVSGFTYNGKQYTVFRKDTSLENDYPPVDEAQANSANTPEQIPESIIITNPEGTEALFAFRDADYAPNQLPIKFLEAGTKLTNVSIECQENEGFELYVTGFADDGQEYYIMQEDTSLPLTEAQINLIATPEQKDEPLIWPWIVLIIVVIVGVGIFSAYLKQPQCPKCKSRGSKEVKRQFLNSERVLFKEEERIKEYDNKGRGRSNTAHKAASNQYVNPPTKIIVKEKLVEGTREYYNVTYQCNKCGEQYTRKEYVDRKPKIV